MTDAIVRTKVESTGEARVGEGKTPDSQPIVELEVPYTDYEAKNGHPYTVDYFDIGKYWDEGMGGYEDEIAIIEDFIFNKIKTGEWANDRKKIKAELKKIERVTNMKDETRKVVKVGTMVAHINFLTKSDKIKKDFGKYGNN
jgi:hypothetical protein